MTPREFAVSLLGELGAPVCADNVDALIAWQASEGGHYVAKWASFNPLCTSQPMPGDKGAGNRYGVRGYTSWRQGLDATVKTLRNGHYAAILSSLAACRPAVETMHAIGNGPWGTVTLATATSARPFAYYGSKEDWSGTSLGVGAAGLLALLGVGAALWWWLRAQA